MLKNLYAANFLLACLFASLIILQFAFKKPGEHKKAQLEKITGNRQGVPKLPDQLSFAGEKAPVDRWDVKEAFDKEFLINYYDQGNIFYLLKLAHKNFPVISELLKANGVPDDFKYLCIAESNIQSWALSKAGAVGYWQIMKGTAPAYGLKISAEVDERQHLAKSTQAACQYFKAAYTKFGNWTAAAASYNCGMAGYNRQATFQGTTNYYDLYLPHETNSYIFRILTFKYLLENANDLGFDVKEEEKYITIPSRAVTVSSTIPDLSRFATANGSTYKILRLMNPWVKSQSLTVKNGNSYILKLPE